MFYQGATSLISQQFIERRRSHTRTLWPWASFQQNRNHLCETLCPQLRKVLFFLSLKLLAHSLINFEISYLQDYTFSMPKYTWTITTVDVFFYVCREVDLMITAKVIHTSCIYLDRLSFYLYVQPIIISKCITLMTSKRQRHTYISETGNMVEIGHLEN